MVWYVLGDLGQEVQGIEDFEVARYAPVQVLVTKDGKGLAVRLLGAIDDLAACLCMSARRQVAGKRAVRGQSMQVGIPL